MYQLVLYADEASLFDNELVLNTAKFHFSQLKYVDKPNIVYDNIVIAYSPNVNFLVITLIETLKWHAHTDILQGGARNVVPLIVHNTFLLLQKHLTSGTELTLIGWKIVPNEEHVQCDHRFASQPPANEPLHSSQLFDTSLQKASGTTSLCGP